MANTNTNKYTFPAQPGNGLTINLLSLTGQAAKDARRISVCLRSSHDSAASGLTFDVLMENGTATPPTTYRTWQSYTHPAFTAATPAAVYLVAVPVGARGIQVNYVNSANVLTSWEGLIGTLNDEIAGP